MRLNFLSPTANQLAVLRDLWLSDRINTSAPGNPVIKGGLCSMYLLFKKHSAAGLIDDEAMLDQLRLKAGVASQTWKNQAPSATCRC